MRIIHFISIAMLALSACNQSGRKTDKPLIDTLTAPDIQHKEALDTVSKITHSNDPIAAIRRQVTAINTNNPEKKHTEFQCDELMKVDRFFSKGKLAKISIDYGWIGDAHAIEDYYYDTAGHVIFFYEFVEGGPACDGCITKNEYRSYISDGKVIKYLKNQTPEECRKCEFGFASKAVQLYTAITAEDLKRLLCK